MPDILPRVRFGARPLSRAFNTRIGSTVTVTVEFLDATTLQPVAGVSGVTLSVAKPDGTAQTWVQASLTDTGSGWTREVTPDQIGAWVFTGACASPQAEAADAAINVVASTATGGVSAEQPGQPLLAGVALLGATIDNVSRRANGLTLKQARTLEWLRSLYTEARFDNPLSRAVMSSPPTVTTSTTADGTLTNIFSVTGATSSVFSYHGGARVDFLTNYTRLRSHTANNVTEYGLQRYECVVDAAVFEVSTYPTSPTAHNFRFIVDGQYVSLTATAPATFNAQSFFKLDFSAVGGRRRRHIVLEWSNSAGLRHVAVAPTNSVLRRPGTPFRVFYQGDSFVSATTNAAGGFGIGGVCSKLLGIDDAWVGGVGGTGWLVNNGGVETTFRQRNADIIAANPDIVVIAGGYNDRTTAFGNNLLRDEVAVWISQTRAALPNALFFVVGCWPGSLGPNSNAIYAENQIAAGVTLANDAATFFLPVCTDTAGSWVTGTGRTDAPNGTGNSDIYQGRVGDVTHPSDAGYLFYGERLADAIMRACDAVLQT